MHKGLWSKYCEVRFVYFVFYRISLENDYKMFDAIPLKITSIKDFLKDTEHLIKDPMIEIPYEIDFDIPDWVDKNV